MKYNFKQSCPLGLTSDDLDEILGVRREEFGRWMAGQTMTICEGYDGHHGRVHDEHCMTDGTGYFSSEKAHEEGDEFTWRCSYTGTFWKTASVCKDNPHGVVVYPWDLERFLEGLPVID